MREEKVRFEIEAVVPQVAGVIEEAETAVAESGLFLDQERAVEREIAVHDHQVIDRAAELETDERAREQRQITRGDDRGSS